LDSASNTQNSPSIQSQQQTRERYGSSGVRFLC
jgi:hypothetical protein